MSKEENKEFVGGLTTALLLIAVAIVGIVACIQVIFNIF
jgi:Tfp pilus assembly protein PilE